MRRHLLFFLQTLPRLSYGQATVAALTDRVTQLVEKLDSEKAETRDQAEKSLVKLGARAIPVLPDTSKKLSDRQKAALDRVRAALAEDMEKTKLDASKVTIQATGIRLSEAIKQLQRQTGNPITDLREQAGAEATNPSLDLDIVDKPFFEALDLIAEKGGVSLNFYTADGTIGLMPGAAAADDKPDQIGEEVKPAPKPRVLYVGPFRVQLNLIASSRDLRTGLDRANAQFEVAWEPRLRPMLLALKSEEIKIIDDRDEEVAPEVSGESASIILRPENPSSEMNLNMAAPDRAARVLKSLKVRADVTVPAGIRTFRFPKLTAENITSKQGDMSVELESTEVDEAVWKVNVTLKMAGEGPAFESYRQGLFNNRIWLQKPDGSRFELNGGFSNTASDGGTLSFEYLFVDAPGKPADYGFVYETPSKILTIPLEFEFKDVPLP
jgi:hypothetical protein